MEKSQSEILAEAERAYGEAVAQARQILRSEVLGLLDWAKAVADLKKAKEPSTEELERIFDAFDKAMAKAHRDYVETRDKARKEEQ